MKTFTTNKQQITYAEWHKLAYGVEPTKIRLYTEIDQTYDKMSRYEAWCRSCRLVPQERREYAPSFGILPF